MNIRHMFPQKHFDARDLRDMIGEEITAVTIEKVDFKTKQSKDFGDAKADWFLFVEELAKPIKISPTAGYQIADILGSQETDEWVGRVVGIGAVPVTDLAEAAGLATENGIAVNAAMQTSHPAIYAIGDCVSFPQAQVGRRLRLESVQNATDQARAVAKALTGAPGSFDAVPWFWSDIGDMKLQIVGLNHAADRRIIWSSDGAVRAVFHMRANTLAAVETLNEPGVHMLSRRLIALGLTPDEASMARGDLAAMKQVYAAHASS